jgi:hypothetical protein
MPVYEMAHPVYGEIVSERRERNKKKQGQGMNRFLGDAMKKMGER